MRYKFLTYLTLTCAVALCSCTERTASLEELKVYPLNAENGLLKVNEHSDKYFELYYKPKELIIHQELDGLKDEGEIRKIRQRYDSVDYFMLRLSSNGHEIENDYAGNPAAFTKVIEYLSYGIATDVKMVTGGDTLTVADALYARSFGTAPATQVMIVFKSDLAKSGSDATVLFNDTMFGTGLNEFEFKNKDITKIPRLTNQ